MNGEAVTAPASASNMFCRVTLIRRLAFLAFALLALGSVASPPAGADAAEPGGTASVVDRLNPEVDGVSLEATGGDAFIELDVDSGVEVTVFGYDGEPYIRVLADGTVEQNLRSPAVGLNSDRFGGAVNAEADSSAEPEWEVISSDGSAAWHDHRTHWMLESDPVAAPDGVIQEFAISMEVDGEPVLAEGRLLLIEQGFPWAIGVAIVVAIGSFLLPRWTHKLLVTAGIIAVALSWASWADNPPEAGAVPWAVGLALLGLVAAAGSSLSARRQDRQASISRPLGLSPWSYAALGALTGWWVFRVSVLWAPVVPTLVPGWLDRAGTAFVCGATLGLIAHMIAGPTTSFEKLSEPK